MRHGRACRPAPVDAAIEEPSDFSSLMKTTRYHARPEILADGNDTLLHGATMRTTVNRVDLDNAMGQRSKLVPA